MAEILHQKIELANHVLLESYDLTLDRISQTKACSLYFATLPKNLGYPKPVLQQANLGIILAMGSADFTKTDLPHRLIVIGNVSK